MSNPRPEPPSGGCFGPLLDEVQGFAVMDCRRCGFKHVHPRPTAEELRRIYRHEYYEQDKPCMIEHQAEDAPWWRLVDDRRLEFLEREAPAAPCRSLLDVGCGTGRFLLRARERGWQVRGLEPSRRAAAHAREQGLAVEECFLDEYQADQTAPFAAVTMHEVLEHIPDPGALVRRCVELLAPGGLLALSVPNDYSPLQGVLRDLGTRPWWVAPPHHLNFFDFASLRGLLERSGLAVLHEEGSFPMELFLLMGDNYLDDPALGRLCHGKRKHLELALEQAGRRDLLDGLGRALATAGLGRTIWMVGRKPLHGGEPTCD